MVSSGHPDAGSASSNDTLTSVSCASSGACTAVGYYATSSGREMTLAEAWDGSAWTAQATPNPSTTLSSVLTGVSCAASACAAVGYSSKETTWEGLAEERQS
jgi:hypothetical protein